MKKHILYLLCLFSFTFINAQQILTGKVIDDESQTGFPYVNIGIENKGVGTISNNDGTFTLKLNEQISDNDEVVFSHIGYESQRLKVTDLLKMNIITLKAEVNALDEVLISANKGKLKEKRLGRKSSGLIKVLFYGFYSNYEHDVVDDALGKETGMSFKIKEECKINKLNFYILTNQYKSLKFRVNFYEIEDGLPGNFLFNKNILFEVKDGFTGWFQVDLEEYDLYLDKEIEDIAVTIQWVESEKMNTHSKYFNIPLSKSFNRTQYIRNKAMDSWNKQKTALSFYLDTSCYQ